ncbi:hypothetical protein B0G71_4372 [Paraburkholderia sp. BL27I4N3]|uniref:hypothetical protein n=1 Tax=Paraburkholderia sp. BL27I4N3 TaxID=1938805 RepID=UPI000E26C002|nr:hypothetical protein [Paraburkholderia sp. BL27I4N3]REE21220.1 hypothetical protein B0G71_4372 [Paraburkholderia sp. BL27I4N3]
MSVNFAKPKALIAAQVPPVAVPLPKPKKKGGGSTKPKAPPFDLDTPARVRNYHFQFLLGNLSASAFHDRRRKGLVPPPDGNDGRPFWLTETVRAFLTKGGA